jgi:predicted regulator of amino acid metabolism with ACT domain
MWSEILSEFADSPSQAKVARFLLENGFGVNDEGRVVANDVEIPATHIAHAIGSDRRVVDATAKRVLSNPTLAAVFRNLRSTPDLSRVGRSLGLSVITVIPRNAQEKGIVGAVVRAIVDHNLGIRQIFVNDPYLSEEPRLVVIVDGTPPAVLYEEIRSLPMVQQIII